MECIGYSWVLRRSMSAKFIPTLDMSEKWSIAIPRRDLILTKELREKSSIKWPHISKFQTVGFSVPLGTKCSVNVDTISNANVVQRLIFSCIWKLWQPSGKKHWHNQCNPPIFSQCKWIIGWHSFHIQLNINHCTTLVFDIIYRVIQC